MALVYALFITRINEGVPSHITPYLGEMGLFLSLGYMGLEIRKIKKRQ
jgi:hypothetical protein